MINILSYIGMNMQSEVCLWTLLGLVRTIFDATLFKVNANLKQVWQMSMPVELSMPVQRVLRTMISGIMLVQCFTVYVYLASYIVLLYPVFLEERPTLVLPWLLLAAIRKLLCELTSLALGLGTCVLVGPAKPPCIKFLITKISTIMPAFYMWMLVYSYYHALKVASTFKSFPAVLAPIDPDYGLELAVRRRRTKSLLGEEQLRKKLVAGFYAERPYLSSSGTPLTTPDITTIPEISTSSNSSVVEVQQDKDELRPNSTVSHRYTEVTAYDDWIGIEMQSTRGDRILDQFVVMLLRIGIYLARDGADSIKSQMFNSTVTRPWVRPENIEAMPGDETDTPPHIGTSKGHTASYLRDYPQIFMKKLNSEASPMDSKLGQMKKTESNLGNSYSRTHSSKSCKSTKSLEIKTAVSDRKINPSNNKLSQVSTKDQLVLYKPKGERETSNVEETTNKLTLEEIERSIENRLEKMLYEEDFVPPNSKATVVESMEIMLPISTNEKGPDFSLPKHTENVSNTLILGTSTNNKEKTNVSLSVEQSFNDIIDNLEQIKAEISQDKIISDSHNKKSDVTIGEKEQDSHNAETRETEIINTTQQNVDHQTSSKTLEERKN